MDVKIEEIEQIKSLHKLPFPLEYAEKLYGEGKLESIIKMYKAIFHPDHNVIYLEEHPEYKEIFSDIAAYIILSLDSLKKCKNSHYKILIQKAKQIDISDIFDLIESNDELINRVEEYEVDLTKYKEDLKKAIATAKDLDSKNQKLKKEIKNLRDNLPSQNVINEDEQYKQIIEDYSDILDKYKSIFEIISNGNDYETGLLSPQTIISLKKEINRMNLNNNNDLSRKLVDCANIIVEQIKEHERIAIENIYERYKKEKIIPHDFLSKCADTAREWGF